MDKKSMLSWTLHQDKNFKEDENFILQQYSQISHFNLKKINIAKI